MHWKLALAQHPMYLIIKEDTSCVERTPPWGAASITDYIERVRENLATVRRYPGLKVGFEWSAVELEMLARDAPDVFADMRALANAGRVTFYNGTYAQPHLQTLSSEANWRQFEYGMQVYRELLDWQVRTYEHQEASVHDQVPQLLQAFGLKFADAPGGFWTLDFLQAGEIMLHGLLGLRLPDGHEFVMWRGLDGTEIPLYIHQSPSYGRQFEAITGMQRRGPIMVDMADMQAVNDDWVAERKDVDIVHLDEALAERLEQRPPRATARLYSNWSYIEGIRAEELSRCNWRAEAAVLCSEALNCIGYALVGRPAETAHRIWKMILASQHHDAYCFCGPELKDKAVRWLRQAEWDAQQSAESAARAVIAKVDCAQQAGEPLVVFSSSPHERRELVSHSVSGGNVMIVDALGNLIPCENVPVDGGGREVRFLADLPGLGYATYYLRSRTELPIEGEFDFPVEFANDFFRAMVNPDITFASLQVMPGGCELLDGGAFLGNQLAAMDSRGLSPRSDGPIQLEDPRLWQPPQEGPQLSWEATAPSRIRRTPLGITLTATGRLGDEVQAETHVTLYHRLSRIDLSWTFDFASASIGTFFDDESKLCVRWPMAFTGAICHDIAFGVIPDEGGRPFFPAGWVDISDGDKGLAYFHRGTPKHWVSGRTLVNLFAWGEDTDAIHNRTDRYRWPKSFDQRLRGRHTIEAAIFPHRGDWRAAGVVGMARSYVTPVAAYTADRHPGDLPAKMTLLTLTDPGLSATSLQVRDGEVHSRVYAAGGEPATIAAKWKRLQPVALRSLGGETLAALAPFQIGDLVLQPTGSIRENIM